jgi:MinD-like ATPase involved in chromosome partitioning or flagellar assembly
LVREVVSRPHDPGSTDGRDARPEPEPLHEHARRRGAVVAVWGPTGAPGRTTVASNMAAASAELGRRSLLIDADVYGGTVASLLGMLDESSGLLAAARAANHGELHPDVLAHHARAINPTLRVLSGLPRADRWVEVGSVLMGRILETATQLCDVTVVDCAFCLETDEELSYDTVAPRRNGATIEILGRADLVVVVGAADPVSLARLVRAIHDLRSAVPAAVPYVVVNRVRGGLGWSDQDVTDLVTRATGFAVAATLPDDPSTCDQALVSGKTLVECAPDSRLSRRVKTLTADVLGLREPVRRRRAGRVR